MEVIFTGTAREDFASWFILPDPGTRIGLHLIGGTIKHAHGGRNRRVSKTGESSMERCGARSIHRLDAANTAAGDVIPGADGARKVRWGRAGKGKRGGVRVIYSHLADDEIVLLVMLYAKALQANVKPKDIKRG